MAGTKEEGEGAMLRAMARQHVAAPSLRNPHVGMEDEGREEASPLRTPRGSFDAREGGDAKNGDERGKDRGETLPKGSCVSLLVLQNQAGSKEDKDTKLVHELERVLRKRKVDLNKRTVQVANGINGTEDACYGCAAAILVVEACEWDERKVVETGRRVMEALRGVGVPRVVCALVERRNKTDGPPSEGHDKQYQPVEDAWVKVLQDMDRANDLKKRNILWTVVRIKASTNWSRMLSCLAGAPALKPVVESEQGKRYRPSKADEEETGRLLADLIVHIPPELQRKVLQVATVSRKG